MNLLLINDIVNPYKYHCNWIEDLGRILTKINKHKGKKHPCCRCLYVFSSKNLLESYVGDREITTL